MPSMDLRSKVRSLVEKHGSLGLTGGPGVGKTTLLLQGFDGVSVHHTDDYKHLPWEHQKVAAARDFANDPAKLKIIEGVTVARMARLASPPFGAVVVLNGDYRHVPGKSTSGKRRSIGAAVDTWLTGSRVPVIKLS